MLVILAAGAVISGAIPMSDISSTATSSLLIPQALSSSLPLAGIKNGLLVLRWSYCLLAYPQTFAHSWQFHTFLTICWNTLSSPSSTRTLPFFFFPLHETYLEENVRKQSFLFSQNLKNIFYFTDHQHHFPQLYTEWYTDTQRKKQLKILNFHPTIQHITMPGLTPIALPANSLPFLTMMHIGFFLLNFRTENIIKKKKRRKNNPQNRISCRYTFTSPYFW